MLPLANLTSKFEATFQSRDERLSRSSRFICRTRLLVAVRYGLRRSARRDIVTVLGLGHDWRQWSSGTETAAALDESSGQRQMTDGDDNWIV